MYAFITQETDNGPVTGGVGAVATARPRVVRNSGARVAASGISSLIAVGLGISLT